MLKKSNPTSKQLSDYSDRVLLNENFFSDVRFNSLIDILDDWPTEMIHALSTWNLFRSMIPVCYSSVHPNSIWL